MPDVKMQLRSYLANTPEVTIDDVRLLAAQEHGTALKPMPNASPWRGPLVALGTAVAVLMIAAITLLLRNTEGDVAGVDTTVASESTAPAVPPAVAEQVGTITVNVSNLTDGLGDDLAGVLMTYDATSPSEYKWEGVAGFTVAVDSDPFSTAQVLGEVTEAWPDDLSAGMWPWAHGEAKIPAGDYTLWLWSGTDYCCDSRWMPAASTGLRGCELPVSTTGQDQTIHVTDIPPDGGPCDTGPAPPTATSGTITISLQGLSGFEGYQLLAGVWSEVHDPSLVGGAFWTTIDSDPYSTVDVVHPALYPNTRPERESWGDDDYAWEETAQLEPGAYRIQLWANPGRLDPYGSHIPGGSVERECTVDVEVIAGESTTLVVADLPVDVGQCPTVEP